jgi:hypothetical protein
VQVQAKLPASGQVAQAHKGMLADHFSTRESNYFKGSIHKEFRSNFASYGMLEIYITLLEEDTR